MPEKFGNFETPPPEEPKSPELKENLAEWRREILKSNGLESIADLEETIDDIKLNLEGLEKGSEEYNSLLGGKAVLEQILEDVKADHEITPEEIESDIEKSLQQLRSYDEIFDKLDKEMQERWYGVEMGAEVEKDRKGARAKLEIFLEKLKPEADKFKTK